MELHQRNYDQSSVDAARSRIPTLRDLAHRWVMCLVERGDGEALGPKPRLNQPDNRMRVYRIGDYHHGLIVRMDGIIHRPDEEQIRQYLIDGGFHYQSGDDSYSFRSIAPWVEEHITLLSNAIVHWEAMPKPHHATTAPSNPSNPPQAQVPPPTLKTRRWFGR